MTTDLPPNAFYFLCHHEGPIVEFVTDPYERIRYIKENKPAHEIPVRLHCFQPVRGKLPDEIIKTWAACAKAWAACAKAWAAYNKAWAACAKALAKHMPQLEKMLFEQIPDCPWDGKTIFPEKETEK